MYPVHRFGASLVLAAAAFAFFLTPSPKEVTAAAAEPATTPPPDLSNSAISAVIAANGNKLPESGEQLWKAVSKLGKFAQLPVPYSAVRLDSGIDNPRVVLAPIATGVSQADVTGLNFEGRLFLAANMEKDGGGGDPAVTSIEFISWNTARRRFDFGVIDYLAGTGDPEVRLATDGRCFSCHKNYGPILGAKPWSNTAHDDILRYATAVSMKMSGTGLPDKGPFALPKMLPGGAARRERIDGMALIIPQAPEVDAAVRIGANLQTNREVFRLMVRTPDGRKAFVHLLEMIAEPGALDANDKAAGKSLDAMFNNTFSKFATGWMEIQRGAKSSVLADIDPTMTLIASGVRPAPRSAVSGFVPVTTTVSVPGLVGGGGTRWVGPPVLGMVTKSTTTLQPLSIPELIAQREKKAYDDYAATLIDVKKYDTARMHGNPGLLSRNQPSNPKAYIKAPVPHPVRPSEILNPVLLADTIGLTDGDRRYFARSLADAVKQTNAAKLTTAHLAREVFESQAFTDFFQDAAPLPDRDDFKDRFTAGLDDVLKNKYGLTDGFAPERSSYASGARYKPQSNEKEVVLAPTTACMRCHEVAGKGKARFDPIPTLAFDPFDKLARAAWLKSADPKRKYAVLARFAARMTTDADMPPEDSPEHELFKTKDAAGFNEAKRFVATELDRLKGK